MKQHFYYIFASDTVYNIFGFSHFHSALTLNTGALCGSCVRSQALQESPALSLVESFTIAGGASDSSPPWKQIKNLEQVEKLKCNMDISLQQN